MFFFFHQTLQHFLLTFQPPTGSDTMVKAGVTTSINTKHQCITAMKEYENKSLEVRLKSERLSNLIVGVFFVEDKILTCCF